MISLDDMSQLASALLTAEAEVEKQEAILSLKKETARRLREEAIPCAMQELDIDELKLGTGQSISIKQDVYASIPKDAKDVAFGWLEDNGFGGLIKVEVTVQFGKAEKKFAEKLFKQLRARKNPLDPQLSMEVNPQTLKAFLREQLAAGSSIPLDIFGARPTWVAKVKMK